MLMNSALLTLLLALAPAPLPPVPPATPPTRAAADHLVITRDPADSPIEVRRIARHSPHGPLRIYAALINVTDPRVRIITTAATEQPTRDPVSAPRDNDKSANSTGAQPEPAGIELRAESILQPTDAWARQVHATLAVNAHFFGYPDNSKGPWIAGKGVDLKGPCITDGLMVSPSEPHASPAFAFFTDRTACVGMLTAQDLREAEDAVSGICNPKRLPAPTTSPTAESDDTLPIETPNALLVRDGLNTGMDAHPGPTVRHPRTALGLNAAGNTLILVVVDGRQPELSVGMTLVELADLLIELGAHDAINLDGGGSSSFYFDPDGPGPRTDLITNSPSDQVWRPVGSSLGIIIADATPNSPQGAQAPAPELDSARSSAGNAATP